MHDVNKIVLRMRESINASGDKELGEHFGGIRQSTITSWKKRPSVPYQYIDQLTQETGRTFEWFLTGEEPKPIVSYPPEPYQSEKKYPVDLQRIIDEWPDLCPSQRAAIISVLDAFSKQTPLSLKISDSTG